MSYAVLFHASNGAYLLTQQDDASTVKLFDSVEDVREWLAPYGDIVEYALRFLNAGVVAIEEDQNLVERNSSGHLVAMRWSVQILDSIMSINGVKLTDAAAEYLQRAVIPL